MKYYKLVECSEAEVDGRIKPHVVVSAHGEDRALFKHDERNADMSVSETSTGGTVSAFNLYWLIPHP